MKRGQITIFLLIGIVILISFLFVIMLYSLSMRADVPLVFDRSSINNYITTCIGQTADDALIKLGKQGGTLDHIDFIQTPLRNVEYSTDLNVSLLHTKEQMQDEISRYVENNLNSSCLDGFYEFTKRGWQVEAGNIEADTSIYDNSVSIMLDMPVSVTFQQQTITIDEFSHDSQIRLGYIHNTLTRLIDSMIINEGQIDLDILSGTGLDTNIFTYDNTMMISLEDRGYQFLTAVE